MPDIKLSRLPDRTPVKLTLSILPELHQQLQRYAELYRTTYGTQEPVVELIPHMLSAFLSGDRAFTKARSAVEGDR